MESIPVQAYREMEIQNIWIPDIKGILFRTPYEIDKKQPKLQLFSRRLLSMTLVPEITTCYNIYQQSTSKK